MPSSLVERATSDMLIGPDWAMNMEICDILNHDPGIAKDVARGIKKRIGSRNPKVQLLALTLLETMIQNCGDIVHMHVAERDIPHEMAKIVKKKPDFHVKEKILVLIDTWQEAFGGAQARYPQFFAAYQELLRAGAVFPQKRNRSAPTFSAKTHPGHKKRDYQQQEPCSSADSGSPVLSLAEIRNARVIMDVLADMLNALDPGNKEELRQEVIIDLVGQCRSYRQRVVHLVNTTSDEDLLCHGLALNDDLQCVLAKHDAIAAGTAASTDKPKSLQALVEVDDPAVTGADGSTDPDQRSTASTSNQPPLQQLLLPAPRANGEATSSANTDPLIDLLSGEDLNTPAAENSLALVPVSEPVADSASEQNAYSDMFSQNRNINGNGSPKFTFNVHSIYPAQQLDPASPQFQLQQQQLVLCNGGISNSGIPKYEQVAYAPDTQLSHADPVWNSQALQCLNPQQHDLYGTNEQSGSLPPPPWETQPTESSQLVSSRTQLMQADHMGEGLYPHAMPDNQLIIMHQKMMQGSQLGSMRPGLMQGRQHLGMFPPTGHISQNIALYSQPMSGGQLTGYTYGQQPGAPQFYDPRSMYPYASPDDISQRMYGLSMRDNSQYTSTTQSYQMPNSSSHGKQPAKPSRPEDNVFGDLVTMAKSRQNKSSANNSGL